MKSVVPGCSWSLWVCLTQTRIELITAQIHGLKVMQTWPDMTSAQKHSICDSIADYWNQLLSLRFDTIGSLITGTGAGQPSVTHITVGPLSMMCSQNQRAYASPSRNKCGPFATVKEWLLAVAKLELRFKSRPQLPDPHEEERRLAAGARQTEANVALLKEKPLLWNGGTTHSLALNPPDFRHHNVLVSFSDPTKILAVIDWEGTKVSPIWNILKRPSFCFSCPFLSSDELNQLIWEKVGELNPEWADAMANGGSLRNASTLAEVSDWDPEDYKLELPGSLLSTASTHSTVEFFPDKSEILMRQSSWYASRTGA
ncbi:hypothetical protein FB45DRAFT_764967 [Roridomyces roridus]|uniref:Aminoglycoside phosphotransferase domain-containing protein n=1 Tax=Roridomyces roridus TaxID=1738132 RepID=A0AAD7F7F4_9AGAR|nr:hypothetical protein FB45DRAFT_764967 [Roridomyces roridus]